MVRAASFLLSGEASDLALLEVPRVSPVSDSLVCVFASTGNSQAKAPPARDSNQRQLSTKVPDRAGRGSLPSAGGKRLDQSADSEPDHRDEDHNADQACDEDDPACAGSQDDLALPRLLSRKDGAFITILIAVSIAPITAHDRLLPWNLSRTTTALRLKFRMTASARAAITAT
ncbi:hypothetical protein NKJ06_00915 [Mesorhizobium sp. M0293]|uniref:hypothetical protein n=1 Tax=Mesorhizobium sp. M0293 TaxID=2956930 RepID=UPI003336AA2A